MGSGQDSAFLLRHSNLVSSQSKDVQHYALPISFLGLSSQPEPNLARILAKGKSDMKPYDYLARNPEP